MATVGIGSVTGDADFFLMTEVERLERGLPIHALQPVVSRARHARYPSLSLDRWRSLLVKGERVWMFRPNDFDLDIDSINEYIAGSSKAVRSRSHVMRRSPWYRPVLPPTPHAFLSGTSQRGPWLTFSRMRGLQATNTLYTVRFKRHLPLLDRYAWSVAFMTSRAREHLAKHSRIYAGGLRKLEPTDVAKTPLRIPKNNEGAEHAHNAAVRALIRGDIRESSLIADRWIN